MRKHFTSFEGLYFNYFINMQMRSHNQVLTSSSKFMYIILKDILFCRPPAAYKWNWSQYSNRRLNVNLWERFTAGICESVSRSGLRGVMRSCNLFMSSANEWKMRNLCNIVGGNWSIQCAWTFINVHKKGLNILQNVCIEKNR